MVAPHRKARSFILRSVITFLPLGIGAFPNQPGPAPRQSGYTQTLIRLDGEGHGEIIDVRPAPSPDGDVELATYSGYGAGSRNTPCVYSQTYFRGDSLCFYGTGYLGITSLTHTSHAGQTWNGIKSYRANNSLSRLMGPSGIKHLAPYEQVFDGPDGGGTSTHADTIEVNFVGADQEIKPGSIVVEDSNLPGKTPLCLDVQGGNTANGTPVWLWPCNGAPAQIWNWGPSSFQLRALGKCLDLATPPGGAGAKLQIWDCNYTEQQKWNLATRLPLDWGHRGRTTFLKVGTNLLVIDVPNNYQVQGQTMQVWHANYGPPQTFWEYRIF